MNQKHDNKDVARALLIAILAASISACEMNATLGVHPVDSYQSETHYKNRGLRCLWTNCDIKPEESGS